MLLTAGSLAQHLDASLCVALGFLKLALIGVGGRIRATDRRHQGRTIHSLANTLSLGRVSRVALTYSTEAAQHPSAACQTGRKKKEEVLEKIKETCDHNIDFSHNFKVSHSSSNLSDHKPAQCIVQLNTLMSAILVLHLSYELIMHAQSQTNLFFSLTSS